MTDTEKQARLAVLIAPDVATDALLHVLIEQSAGIVLNRRYPFGVPDAATVPEQYETVQLQIAVELYTKMGAEGQTGHSENGVSRTYEAADVSPSLLRRIVPLVGSVM